MKILLYIKTKLFRLFFGQNQNELLSVEEITQFVNKIGCPDSLNERSYYQYLCQKKKYSKSIGFRVGFLLLNFVSFFAIVILLCIPEALMKKQLDNNQGKADAVCLFSEHIKDRIPEELYVKYDKFNFLTNLNPYITSCEKKFILRIWRKYFFSTNFILKNFLKIGMYRKSLEIAGYPKAIIVTSEDSYTSSILTLYCHEMGVNHINIMHGEILYQLNRMYFAFDRCYVWDEYYKELSIKLLHADPYQFRISIPQCLIFNNIYPIKIPYKYYLQDHSLEQLIHVKELMENLGADYCVRPHPIFSNMKDVYKVFEAEKIEETVMPIEKSIMESEVVVAWDSTVLFQAYLNGRKTIIDDVTNVERYQYALDAKYIMIDKSLRLSKIVWRNQCNSEI